MAKVPTAKDFMHPPTVTLHPDMDVFDAIEALARKRESGAPVVDEANKLTGILTEKDCLRVLSAEAYGNMASGRVRDYMSEVKLAATPGMDLFAVAHLFLASNFATLPVLEGDTLVGRISRQDMLRGILQFQRTLEAGRVKEGQALKTLQQPESIEELQNLVGSQKKEQLAAVLSRRHHQGG